MDDGCISRQPRGSVNVNGFPPTRVIRNHFTVNGVLRGMFIKSLTSVRRFFPLLFTIVLCLSTAGRATAAAPPAPSLVSPADGAVVTEPFTISWTAVSDPSGIVAYNWQVSSSSRSEEHTSEIQSHSFISYA